MNRLLALVVAASLLLSGCSGGDEEEPLEALPLVERSVQTNADRDADEVLEKAGAIDPCALLRAGHPAGGVSRDSVPRADSPHSCWMSDSSVKADVFTSVSEQERHRLDRQELAGVVSYRADLDDGGCLVHLPISHDHAISFSGGARCATVTKYAAAAAELLQAYAGRTSRPRGIQQVSACALLEAAGRSGQPAMVTHYTLLDSCDDQASGDSFALKYRDTAVRDYQTTHAVAGTTVRANGSTSNCYLEWTVGKPDVTVIEGDQLVGFVTSASCRKGLRLARAMIPTITGATSSGGDPTDLLYAWDEADTSAVGTCADVVGGADLACAPAAAADVPDTPRDLIMKAEADPDVLCAAAAPTVRDHYGEAMAAVTRLAAPITFTSVNGDLREGATQCAFGSPAHTVEITVTVSTTTPRISNNDEIAGHPAAVDDYDTSRSYVVARDAMDEPGFLVADVRVWSPRGSGPRVTADRAPLEAGDDFVADLADALL